MPVAPLICPVLEPVRWPTTLTAVEVFELIVPAFVSARLVWAPVTRMLSARVG